MFVVRVLMPPQMPSLEVVQAFVGSKSGYLQGEKIGIPPAAEPMAPADMISPCIYGIGSDRAYSNDIVRQRLHAAVPPQDARETPGAPVQVEVLIGSPLQYS